MESTVLEKLGALDERSRSAHERIDRLEEGMGVDIRDIRAAIKDLTAHMNRSIGWASAMMLLSGTLGAFLVKILPTIIKGD